MDGSASNETKKIRLHVSGLPAKILEKDIEDRFKSFGNVQKVDLIPHPFEEGSCRGFAYVDIETTDAQLSKCMNLLNGCSWKGGKLHISLAKPNKFRTLEDGRIVMLKSEQEDEASLKSMKRMNKKKKRKLVRHASDQSLVNDKNVDKRKGWRRGRYGRAIACLKIRRPNRQILIVDPSHYKNNLEKLFGSVRPKPLSQLSWTITDLVEEPKDSSIISEEEKLEEFEEIDVEQNEEDAQMEIVKDSSDFKSDISMEPKEVEEIVEQEVQLSETVESVIPVTETVEPAEIVDNDVVMAQVSDPIVEKKVENSQKSVPEPKFEVNVNWSSLFSSSANNSSTSLFGENIKTKNTDTSSLFNTNSSSGFSLNSLIGESPKIKNVSMDELFKKPDTSSMPVDNKTLESKDGEIQSEQPSIKKIHNYAHLFGDLNRITPTTATRFGMLLSRKEDMLHEWRIERVELKEDFKKRLAEGKRRNRRGNKVNTTE